MSDSVYRVRNYTSDDFDGYVRLHREAVRACPGGLRNSVRALSERLVRPGSSPERDVFLAEEEGTGLVACAEVRLEPGINRAVITYTARPEHEASDVTLELFSAALRRASDLGASVAHVSVPEEALIARTFLSSLAFVPVRRFLEMTLDLSAHAARTDDRAAWRSRCLEPGEEDRLAGLQNRCFGGTWGFNPNTTEDIVHRAGMSDCGSENIILVLDGDRAVGYCWTTFEPDAHRDTGAGRIHMMGTDPDCRGRGIGRFALLAGLSYLKDRGMRVAELTVDSENGAARSLYESVGFETAWTSVWYEKALA